MPTVPKFSASGSLISRHCQPTCIGLGGDPVVGTSFTDALPLFEKDPETDLLVMVGESGGTAEEDGAENAMFEATRVTGPLTIVSVRVLCG